MGCSVNAGTAQLYDASHDPPMPRPMRSMRSMNPLLRTAMPPPPQLPHCTARPSRPSPCRQHARQVGTARSAHPDSMHAGLQQAWV